MKFFQYILLVFWFLLTNVAFAQKDAESWRDNLKIVTQNGKQGVYNTKTKRFDIQPIYDEIYKKNDKEFGIYQCLKIIGFWYDKDEAVKYEYKTIIIDSNNYVFEPTVSQWYSIVNNAKNKKGIYTFRKNLFLTKVEFDTILFVNIIIPYDAKPWGSHTSPSYNYKPNQDLYAILGKKNKFKMLNVEQNKIDTSAYIIYLKSNDESFDNNNSSYLKDSKLQVINLPDSNYEFDSSFYLFNSIKVHVLNTDIVKHNNKYGLYTHEEGKFYLPIEYDSVLQERNYYKTYKNGKLGYARRWSKDNYTIITADSNIEKLVDFDKEIYTLKINEKWEFRNFCDNNRYDSIYIVDEKYTYNRKVFLKKDGKWSLNFMPYEGVFPRNTPTSKYLNKREKNELYKIIRKQPCCGYEYQTHFLWDSIAILDNNYSYYLSKQNNKILILNGGGITQIKLEEKKVNKVGLEKILGGHEFVYVVINKKYLFLKPYKAKMYLYNGKLVKKPKISVYAKINRYVRVRKWKIKSYLRERKLARKEKKLNK
ncbi:MAG: hypothetical protein ACOYMA_18220 [Bacteroidia bacterium]